MWQWFWPHKNPHFAWIFFDQSEEQISFLSVYLQSETKGTNSICAASDFRTTDVGVAWRGMMTSRIDLDAQNSNRNEHKFSAQESLWSFWLKARAVLLKLVEDPAHGTNERTATRERNKFAWTVSAVWTRSCGVVINFTIVQRENVFLGDRIGPWQASRIHDDIKTWRSNSWSSSSTQNNCFTCQLTSVHTDMSKNCMSGRSCHFYPELVKQNRAMTQVYHTQHCPGLVSSRKICLGRWRPFYQHQRSDVFWGVIASLGYAIKHWNIVRWLLLQRVELFAKSENANIQMLCDLYVACCICRVFLSIFRKTLTHSIHLLARYACLNESFSPSEIKLHRPPLFCSVQIQRQQADVPNEGDIKGTERFDSVNVRCAQVIRRLMRLTSTRAN